MFVSSSTGQWTLRCVACDVFWEPSVSVTWIFCPPVMLCHAPGLLAVLFHWQLRWHIGDTGTRVCTLCSGPLWDHWSPMLSSHPSNTSIVYWFRFCPNIVDMLCFMFYNQFSSKSTFYKTKSVLISAGYCEKLAGGKWEFSVKLQSHYIEYYVYFIDI